MSVVERFAAPLPSRQPVDVVVLELKDGRVIARTADELTHAPDEVRLAAGLEPLAERPVP